ncbi:putative ribonuclease H-like domain-containing protein [Tanacetum coccineum]
MLYMDLFGPTNVKSLMKKSYCLVVTDDFSRFSWVFFLATKDETSGILKTFITKIENHLDHKVKVIKGENGIEFKNSVMNQFCELKGIKRKFSVARTPYQNGVAERRNRTLIKAARTMDHLDKFDGKADEGFFVGYSVVSKAMRVFNKRTRIVKETLNIRFLENTSNVTGNGLDWLFDVDSLTISMNYVPVVAGNQTNELMLDHHLIILLGPSLENNSCEPLIVLAMHLRNNFCNDFHHSKMHIPLPLVQMCFSIEILEFLECLMMNGEEEVDIEQCRYTISKL